MPMMIAAAMGGASMGMGALGSMFGSDASKKQLALMQQALQYQKDVNSRTYNDLSPYRDFGKTQLNSLTNFLNTKDPSNYIDPGYQFRLNAGTNAIDNNAATSGMLQSGDTLRALTEYGQNMGSQEYNNAFNRYLGQGNFLQGLTGIGQNAATTGGELANQGASNVANISENTDAGGPERVWGNYFSGMGGMGMSGAGNMMGSQPSSSNAFSNIFKPQQGQEEMPNWMGIYGE